MPCGAERVDDGVGDRGRRCDRARLADALHPERVDRRRGDGLVELEVRQSRGLRQRVVHHRAGQQLAVVAVDRALPERLADALGDAAVELAVHDQRVDLVADVVDRDVAHEVDLAGLLVDLDGRDVGAERPRAVRRVVVGRLVEVRLHALGRVERQVEREGDLLDRLLAVGRALDAVLGAVDLDVVGRRLEHVGGVAPGLVADLVGRLDRGGHPDRATSGCRTTRSRTACPACPSAGR